MSHCERMKVNKYFTMLSEGKENSKKIRGHVTIKGTHARIINQLNQEEKERLTSFYQSD